jgi:hypothetical protein
VQLTQNGNPNVTLSLWLEWLIYAANCLRHGLFDEGGVAQREGHCRYPAESGSSSGPINLDKPDNALPACYGDSVRKWDGGTFVVHSPGFNNPDQFDIEGHSRSDDLRVRESFTRRASATLAERLPPGTDVLG